MEEINLEARQHGVGMSGEMEHVALRARIHHKTGNGSSRQSRATRSTRSYGSLKPMVAAFTPALARFVVECCGERPASAFFRMDSEESTKLEISRGVQQGGAMGPALFCLPLATGAYEGSVRIRDAGGRNYAYIDYITIVAHEILPWTVGAVPFPERELTETGTNLSLDKTVALDPKGHVPTPKYISLKAGVSIRISDEGGMKVVGVPVDTDELR